MHNIFKTFNNLELLQVQKPARYIGEEINSIHKDTKPFSFALAFPDAYEVAQSSLGLKILYNIINSHNSFSCERIFAPLPDMERFLRSNKLNLFSLEEKRNINQFDIVGFTLQYEMTYTNILNMLDLGDIPLFSSERNDSHPLIIGGGPCAFNPEPLADFFDLFAIGDGEESVLEILDTYSRCKNMGMNRFEIIEELSKITGVYIPQLYNPQRDDSGNIISLQSNQTFIPPRVSKRIVLDLNKVPFPSNIIVPYLQTIHDRIMLEIFRGCSRGCRFCKAGYIYRPVRERNAVNVIRLAQESVENTGYDEISLLSLSSSDYSKIEHMIDNMSGCFAGKGVNISIPSLRIDNFSLKLAGLIKSPRKAGLTFAPEAGSQRLRDVINKNITEEQIINTLKEAQKLGWQLVKLYFMIGLPTETEDDIDAIIQLIKKICRETKLKLNVSVSHFVPQPHTPFQWEKMESISELKRKSYKIKEGIRSRRVQFHWHSPYVSYLEGVFSRGDRDLSKTIKQAFDLGSRFDGWSEWFDFGIWEKAFLLSGVNPEKYTCAKNKEDYLPWEIIDTGITGGFLFQEKQLAYEASTTVDCRDKCTGCGICDSAVKHKFSIKDIDDDKSYKDYKDRWDQDLYRQVQKVRIMYSKKELLRWIAHLDTQRVFERALRRAGIPVTYTSGFHPRPKISLAIPLPLGYTSESEWLEVYLHKTMLPVDLKSLLSKEMPSGIVIERVKTIPITEKPIMSNLILNSYKAVLPDNLKDSNEIPRLIEDFIQKSEILIKKKEKDYDIRPLIKKMEYSNSDKENSICLELLMKPEGSIKPDLIIAEMFNKTIASQSNYHKQGLYIRQGAGWVSP